VLKRCNCYRFASDIEDTVGIGESQLHVLQETIYSCDSHESELNNVNNQSTLVKTADVNSGRSLLQKEWIVSIPPKPIFVCNFRILSSPGQFPKQRLIPHSRFLRYSTARSPIWDVEKGDVYQQQKDIFASLSNLESTKILPRLETAHRVKTCNLRNKSDDRPGDCTTHGLSAVRYIHVDDRAYRARGIRSAEGEKLRYANEKTAEDQIISSYQMNDMQRTSCSEQSARKSTPDTKKSVSNIKSNLDYTHVDATANCKTNYTAPATSHDSNLRICKRNEVGDICQQTSIDMLNSLPSNIQETLVAPMDNTTSCVKCKAQCLNLDSNSEYSSGTAQQNRRDCVNGLNVNCVAVDLCNNRGDLRMPCQDVDVGVDKLLKSPIEDSTESYAKQSTCEDSETFRKEKMDNLKKMYEKKLNRLNVFTTVLNVNFTGD